MRNFKMFRSLQKLCKLQALRNHQLHTSPLSPQTWSHFQFLRITRNSSLKSLPKFSKSQNTSAEPPSYLPPPRIALSNNLTSPQPPRAPRNRVFYSTCSDKPPKKPDCTPKPKKCPEKSSCNEKSYEKSCPDYKDQASCSTNKPKCPDKCPPPPKQKPCPPPKEKSCSKPKPKPKPKPCAPPEDRSICVKPPPKSSGCGGGKPPPCSRSYSSCAAAETSNNSPDGLTFGERQRRKIQEFCSKRKGNGITGKNCEQESENTESFADKLKREQEEMTECLRKTTEFSQLGYTRIHCKDYIEDIISTDAKRFLRELDPYSQILRANSTKVSSKPQEKFSKKKINWIESILTQ